MIKAAIYTRVSHQNQADKGSSIDNQIDTLRAYALQRGMEVAGVYEDPAYTGRNFKRPAYQKMMEDIDTNGVQAVIVYSLSRFGRNTIAVLQQIQELRNKGVIFHSLDLQIDTSTPMGQAFLSFVAVLAQLESDQTSSRIKDVQKNRKGRKETYCGNPPYGYRNIKGKMVEIKEELQVVGDIFRIYSETQNINETARRIRSRGIKGKNGGSFTASTIKKILKNEVYK